MEKEKRQRQRRDLSVPAHNVIEYAVGYTNQDAAANLGITPSGLSSIISRGTCIAPIERLAGFLLQRDEVDQAETTPSPRLFFVQPIDPEAFLAVANALNCTITEIKL